MKATSTTPRRAPAARATWPAWLPVGLAVAALTLLGLALRIWFVQVSDLQPIYSPADDGDYYQRALRFATTGQYIDDFWLIRPPLHVMLFALLIRLSMWLGTVDGLVLIRAVQIGLITLTIPLGYDIARRLFNWRAGLIFAAILAVWYPLIELPANLFSEPTFFFLLVLHLWLLLRWRDQRGWKLLSAAGLVLGLACLTRSPTLTGGLFAALWVALESHHAPANQAGGLRLLPLRAVWDDWRARLATAAWWRLVVRNLLIFGLSAAVVIIPWTVRNYLVYERVILIDTLSSVNLWLHLEQYPEKGVEILKTLPQADRHIFAMEDTRRIFWSNPAGFWDLVWRNSGLHFQHIWKAQFAEDLLSKAGFYGRPLREFLALGLASDVIWFVFTLGGLVALVAPLREGTFRVLALLWVSYTVVAMMIMHIEPRYLLPVWLFLALYGAWLLSDPGGLLRLLRRHMLAGALALLVAGVFLGVFFTYRSYPTMLDYGLARETNHAAGVAAYNRGDYDEAVRAFQAAFDAHPQFTESRANLALALVATGDYAAAQALIGSRDTQRLELARGVLARAQGDQAAAAEALIDAEKRAGENVQDVMLWVGAPPTDQVRLGTGTDLGYIHGFSSVEQVLRADGPPVPYRWLQGQGKLTLPLGTALHTGDVVTLQLTSGRPQPVPLTVGFAGSAQRFTFAVQPGVWHTYRLPVPPELAGDLRLTLHLDAPIFIPAGALSGSVDTRPLSLMVHAVAVE